MREREGLRSGPSTSSGSRTTFQDRALPGFFKEIIQDFLRTLLLEDGCASIWILSQAEKRPFLKEQR
jgi:hypothetical protein